MKKAEIHDAAKAFVADHARYIQEWHSRWEYALAPFRTSGVIATTEGIAHPDWDKLTPEVIVDFFNSFWMALPDSPGIHGLGFGMLCDIAENIFGFDDEEESYGSACDYLEHVDAHIQAASNVHSTILALQHEQALHATS